MMNVKPGYKKNSCDGVYDSDYDSYCTLVSYEDFKREYLDYIKKADEKRGQTHKYDIKKNLNK